MADYDPARQWGGRDPERIQDGYGVCSEDREHHYPLFCDGQTEPIAVFRHRGERDSLIDCARLTGIDIRLLARKYGHPRRDAEMAFKVYARGFDRWTEYQMRPPDEWMEHDARHVAEGVEGTWESRSNFGKRVLRMMGIDVE